MYAYTTSFDCGPITRRRWREREARRAGAGPGPGTRAPDDSAGRTAERRRGYAGLYAITPDWHPVIDEVPAGSGHFVCTGFSGHGFKLGPAVGRLTADLVTGEPPLFDAHPFRLARYAEGDPVRGRYEYSITG